MSFDQTAAQLALRARYLTLSVAATGPAGLGASAVGYTRSVGSFTVDGFSAGMEVSGASFGIAGNNGPHIVKAVAALVLTVTGGLAVEAEGAGRSLLVGPVTRRAYENVAFTPVTGYPYTEEEFIAAPPELKSFPYAGGDAEQTGLYTIRLYGIEDVGPTALSKYADAVLALFRPGTIVTTTAGQVLRVRGDFGPNRSAVRADTPGWVVTTITIPWRARYTN